MGRTALLGAGGGFLDGVLAVDPVAIAASVSVGARLNETWKLAGFGEVTHEWRTGRTRAGAGVKVEARW